MVKVKFSFNSTRYIRNEDRWYRRRTRRKLSTPHGTLGTQLRRSALVRLPNFQLHTVHQERRLYRQGITPYLRNFQLHTVHQEHLTKGLFESDRRAFQLHTVHQEQVEASGYLWSEDYLSTPHGTLGTHLQSKPFLWVRRTAFNSTRYIRNGDSRAPRRNSGV